MLRLNNTIIKFIKEFYNITFLKFLIVGGSAALVNFSSRFFFETFFSFIISVALGYLSGSIFSFILNRTIVFKAVNQKYAIQIIKYILAAISSIALGSFVADIIVVIYEKFGITIFNLNCIKSLAHLFAIALTTIYNFLMMKYFCFRDIDFFNRLNRILKR